MLTRFCPEMKEATCATEPKKDQKKKNLPNSINWASLGYLPAVQSQGAKCGSCYAFASVISFYIFNVLFKFHSNILLLLFFK